MTDTKLLKELVIFVEKMMKKRDLNQVSLAQKMGISKQTVNQFLTAKHSPRVETLEQVARALELPVFYLFMSEADREIWDKKTAPTSSTEDRLAAIEAKLNALSNQGESVDALYRKLQAQDRARVRELLETMTAEADDDQERKKGT
jgi:transcriptional regulator with XRE-family HTH domain